MDEEGEPRTLSIQQREDLWQDALDNILVFHSTIARKSLAAGEYSQARIHARCLALGRQTSRRLLEIRRGEAAGKRRGVTCPARATLPGK